MSRLYPIFLFSLLLFCFVANAQKKQASVSGKVVNDNDEALSHVSIIILGQEKGIISSDSGTFHINVPSNKAFALVFSYTGFKPVLQNFLLSDGEQEVVTIKMEPSTSVLKEVVVTDQKDRTETGLIRPNPKSVINIPSPVLGVESLLKVFVGSNNELTSQYNVRGGSYDENLIYVNDFEIFRPYLVQSGQQEGLSFINPELVSNLNFYVGGFQAKYGDKMSSVLDIQYIKPKEFGGSAYVSLLEQGFHFEGNSHNKISYFIAVRNRGNRNVLSAQETQGAYVPSSSDVQASINYQLNNKWQAEILGVTSQTRFSLYPEYQQLTSSVFSPFFTANLGLDVYFNGQEKDQYGTGMIGVSSTYQASKRLKLKWLASRFEDDERENIDITGAYLFGDRDFDKSSSSYGLITNPLGAGVYQNFNRDHLKIVNYNVSHKGNYTFTNHQLQWGAGYDQTHIQDQIHEWEYQDSAGYALPYNPNILQLNHVILNHTDLVVNKLSGYVQDNYAITKRNAAYTLQTGVRINYNDLNHELLISPRINGSWKPSWKRDIIFRAAFGRYVQPPFYRELKDYEGNLHTEVKAQKSWQGVIGTDYNFIAGTRPMRFSAEAYYKSMVDVVSYDINNVHIRYYGNNNAKAYAEGIDLRLFGELVKDAESWVSIGLVRTKEQWLNTYYTSYKIDSLNKPIDSSKIAAGWYRRPTDRMITFGMFFQDYLATNKNFKVYLSSIYGTNLPYNIPGNIQYRNAMIIPAYLRIDIGFSALLLDMDKSNRRSHSPFKDFKSIWASLEVFNLIDRENTISYQLIKDFANNTFALPNRLTPRLVNVKVVARW